MRRKSGWHTQSVHLPKECTMHTCTLCSFNCAQCLCVKNFYSMFTVGTLVNGQIVPANTGRQLSSGWSSLASTTLVALTKAGLVVALARAAAQATKTKATTAAEGVEPRFWCVQFVVLVGDCHKRMSKVSSNSNRARADNNRAYADCGQ